MNGHPISEWKRKRIKTAILRGELYRNIAKKYTVSLASISIIANGGVKRTKRGEGLRRSQSGQLDSDLRWHPCSDRLRVRSNAGHIVLFFSAERRDAFLRAHRIERRARKKLVSCQETFVPDSID